MVLPLHPRGGKRTVVRNRLYLYYKSESAAGTLMRSSEMLKCGGHLNQRTQLEGARQEKLRR